MTGAVAIPKLNIPSGVEHGHFIFLLPYMDQLPLYSKYSFAVNWNNAANSSVVGTQLTVLQCPSVPLPNRTYTSNGVTVASCDYGPLNEVWSNLLAALCPARPTFPECCR